MDRVYYIWKDLKYFLFVHRNNVQNWDFLLFHIPGRKVCGTILKSNNTIQDIFVRICNGEIDMQNILVVRRWLVIWIRRSVTHIFWKSQTWSLRDFMKKEAIFENQIEMVLWMNLPDERAFFWVVVGVKSKRSSGHFTWQLGYGGDALTGYE